MSEELQQWFLEESIDVQQHNLWTNPLNGISQAALDWMEGFHLANKD